MGHKRLIVACDGTWVDSDNGFIRDSYLPWITSGHLATSSNVSRICRALLPRSTEGIPQIVYYQAGIGSENNAYSHFVGGILGEGISENIREAYAFLCSNYEDGDEIFLIGFSRGAFTARSIGGLIADVGLLTAKGLSCFYPVFKDWEHQVDPDYKQQYGAGEWLDTRPKFSDPSYVPKLVEAGLTRAQIPIKAVGVWDTVGTLGVPEMNIFGHRIFTPSHKEYSFVNTEVPNNLEYAYQALALDEQRASFSPTIWERPQAGTPSALKSLRQCWFPGVHSSVGGGYQDTSISDISLAWMLTQLSRHLTFDTKYILLQRTLNVKFYTDHPPERSWALGQIQRSDSGAMNTIAGRTPRTPGEYHATDPTTGKLVDRKLTDTCEFVHPSVRYRIQQKGLGLAASAKSPGQGVYDPVAMKGWTYFAPNQPLPKIAQLKDEWVGYGKWVVQRNDGSTTTIVEDRIEAGSKEMELLEAWDGVVGKVNNGKL